MYKIVYMLIKFLISLRELLAATRKLERDVYLAQRNYDRYTSTSMFVHTCVSTCVVI